MLHKYLHVSFSTDYAFLDVQAANSIGTNAPHTIRVRDKLSEFQERDHVSQHAPFGSHLYMFPQLYKLLVFVYVPLSLSLPFSIL